VNFPPAFVDSLVQVPGLDQPQELLDALSTEAPVSIRLNPAKIRKLPEGLTPVKWSSHGYYLPERPSFVADPLFHAGAYYVQEAASMIIGKVVNTLVDQHFENQSVRVLDLCAAPGGKSTDVIANLRSGDLLLSNEVVKNRAQVLKENVIKWGYPNHLVSNNDPRDFERLPGYFDMVVVDAPCSGEGMFRKDHEARDQWSVDHVKLCSARQERIVADVWPSLTEGGFLIYSTCTFNTAENEDILAFLQNHFGAIPIDLDIFPGNQKEAIHRFYPHQQAGEGFTYFVVKKESAQSTVKLPKLKTRKVADLPFDFRSEGRVVQEQDDFVFYTHDQDTELLSRQLRLLRKGLKLGTRKKNKWIPDPETAFSVAVDGHFPKVSIDEKQAQSYLRCETFDLHSDFKGYQKVSFEGHVLGYINHLGNRFNNYYPSNWRIRTNQPLNRTRFLT
jgi:16S rRNA C967 or C1407 C5-methylase (RsmB/RsmF family)/NOL1/NOP2/fmu family ribosome biogenesis protein